ncbi:MAG: N-acetylmuramoyl-L-alanine amidase [Acidobacteriota bacterium]|nr:N-acetylmuramoyl-L-alanine amidase [Acidobacteriota bacterium]
MKRNRLSRRICGGGRVGLAALAALLAAVPVTTAQLLRSVRVDLQGVDARLPAFEQEGRLMVSLRSLAATLGGRLSSDGAGRFVLHLDERELIFSVDRPSLVRVGEAFISLGADAVVRERDLFVPRDSLSRWLTPRPEVVTARAGTGKVGIVLLGEQPGTLKIAFDLPAPPRRIRPVETGVGRRAWLVESDVPLTLPWRHREIGHDLVAALTLESRGARTMVVALEPGPGLDGVSLAPRETPPGFDVRLRARPVAGPRPESVAAGAGRAVRRIVIDPGHGGEEEGARGPSGLLEKDVVLDVARRLAARLRASGYQVVLTRDGDEDLSLDDRAAIANRERADLFVSIHANASAYSRAVGAETFFLSREATDDAARTTAALENNAAGVVPDPGTGEAISLILWDLAQVEYLEESSELAEIIQQRLNAALGIKDRGVRQAPFRVLVGATCPAVLVELGFMTNPAEEARLGTAPHRRRLAEVLFEAIEDFDRIQQERRAPVVRAVDPSPREASR